MGTGITLTVLVLTLAALVLELLSPDVIFLAALAVLVATGVVDLEGAMAGFSNETLLAIGSFFVIAEGLRRSGALRKASQLLLGGVTSLRGALLRLTGTSAVASAFLNNTPIVAIGVPTVLSWAEDRNDISPSKLLIPLSFASILGGVCTLIGTSTNLVADGLLRAQDMGGLGFFELAMVGLPILLAGMAALVLVVPRFLPERQELHTRREEESIMRWCRGEADFLFRVPDASPLVGKTVRDMELSELGLDVVRISRDATLLAPVSRDETLRGGDYLTFRGSADHMGEVASRWRLVSAAPEHGLQGPFQLREAVVSEGSPLIGEQVDEVEFPSRYGAVVTGVFRHGDPVRQEPDVIRLQPGDTLLLEATAGFGRAHASTQDFYVVGEESDDEDFEAPLEDPVRAKWGVVILALVISLALFEIVHISVAALGGAVAMVATGFVSPGEARRSVDWSVLLVIAAALGVGNAMEASGAAELLARGIVVMGQPLGTLGVLAAVLFACSILTVLITNNAAVVLLFPVAVSAASSVGADPRPFIIATTVAASLSFATPLGYQTNLMIYGPGGYRFTDFIKVGLPLQIALGILAVFLIPIFWPL